MRLAKIAAASAGAINSAAALPDVLRSGDHGWPGEFVTGVVRAE
jgi:hypothetical protein